MVAKYIQQKGGREPPTPTIPLNGNKLVLKLKSFSEFVHHGVNVVELGNFLKETAQIAVALHPLDRQKNDPH